MLYVANFFYKRKYLYHVRIITVTFVFHLDDVFERSICHFNKYFPFCINIEVLFVLLFQLFSIGLNGTGKRVLEVINDGLDLFEHLKQKQILTRDNVVCLQAMLWHTKRKDLHNKFVQFARKRGNIVHFYAPNDKPGNIDNCVRNLNII